MDALFQDLKYAVRLLAKSPGFAVIAVLTLALGIGANSAIFNVVNAVLLRPLPYPQSDELVGLHTMGAFGEGTMMSISYLDYQDIAGLRGSVAGAAVSRRARFNLTGAGEAREFEASQASASLFPVLRIHPMIGRVFTAAEERNPVAVVSHRFWQNSLGADSSALGRMIMLDGQGYEVIGVMPPAMRYPSADVEAWLPIGWAFVSNPQWQTNRMVRTFTGLVRLTPDTRLERLDTELALIATRVNDELRSPSAAPGGVQVTSSGAGPSRAPGAPTAATTSPRSAAPRPTMAFATVSLRDEMVGDRTRVIVVLGGAVALVLLIACANTASLLIARATRRRKEIAVRRAIGAQRGRLIRQLLTESVVLALGGAVVGVLLSFLALRATLSAWPAVLPRQNDIRIDGSVLVFTVGLSLLTGIAFGLIPALKVSSPRLEEELRDESGIGGGRRRRRTLATLIVAEVALALVLLVGAGLLVRSFVALNSVDPGFDSHDLTAARIRLTPSRYVTPAAQNQFFNQLVEVLSGRPGVASVTTARTLPLSGQRIVLAITPRDVRPDDPDQILPIPATLVGPNFFPTFRIPLLQGRPFSAQDDTPTPSAVVINSQLARRLWPGENPIGKPLPLGPPGAPGQIRVVGVVADIRSTSLADDLGPQMFLPLSPSGQSGERWLAVRGPNAVSLAPAILDAVRAVDPQQPVAYIASVEEMMVRDQSARRLNTTLVTALAVIAAMLAAIGIYGVTGYAVAQRRREFGVRIALGAEPAQLIQLVMRENLVLVAVGVVAGLVIAAAASRALSSLLFGIVALDPVTFVGAPMLLSAVALAATLLPAQRAGSVDPMVALRSD